MVEDSGNEAVSEALALAQVSMREAAIELLNAIDGGVISEAARKLGGANGKAEQFLAMYVANRAELTGVEPPATVRKVIDRAEFSRGNFEDHGNSFLYHGTMAIKYTDIMVTRANST